MNSAICGVCSHSDLVHVCHFQIERESPSQSHRLYEDGEGEWADDEAVCGVVVCAQTDRSPRLRNAAADSSSHGFDGRTDELTNKHTAWVE